MGGPPAGTSLSLASKRSTATAATTASASGDADLGVLRRPGEFLTCLADRHADPAGGGPKIGDGCVEGVFPEVVGLPPGNLIEQVRLGPAVQCCRGQDGVLELLVLPAAEPAFRQESLSQSCQIQRPGAAGPAPVSASAATWRKTSPGKVLLRGCNGSSSPSKPNIWVSRASPSSRIRRAVAASSGLGFLLAILRRYRADSTACAPGTTAITPSPDGRPPRRPRRCPAPEWSPACAGPTPAESCYLANLSQGPIALARARSMA